MQHKLRIVKENPQLDDLASVFGAPFTLYSSNIGKSFRNACHQLGKPILLFEGGKSFYVDDTISKIGIKGAKRILNHFDMLNRK